MPKQAGNIVTVGIMIMGLIACYDTDPNLAPGNVRPGRPDASVPEYDGFGLRADSDLESNTDMDSPKNPDTDKDQDGYSPNQGDCDDSNPAIHPDATELCNGIDDNCVDGADEGMTRQDYFEDQDGDGVGVDNNKTNKTACSAPPGYAKTSGDCAPADPFRFPDNDEACDAVDNDCDASTPEPAGCDCAAGPVGYDSIPANHKAKHNGIHVAFSQCGPVAEMYCVRLVEPADKNGWDNNFLCSSRDIGLDWKTNGHDGCLHHVKITEPRDPHGWDDNYLCYERGHGIGFAWHSNYPDPAGASDARTLVQWQADDQDPDSWGDNYLEITDEIAPTWTKWISEETSDGRSNWVDCPAGTAVDGIECKGPDCDEIRLRCRSFSKDMGDVTEKSWVSDEGEAGERTTSCADNEVMAGVRCSGYRCDKLAIRCRPSSGASQKGHCSWTDKAHSDETNQGVGNPFVAKKSFFYGLQCEKKCGPLGIICRNNHCDNKRYRVCSD